MTVDESKYLAERARSSRERWGVVAQATYPHPDYNTPPITISLSRLSNASDRITVTAKLADAPIYRHGMTPRYESVVEPNSPLDTRIRTAFRRMTEAGVTHHLRDKAWEARTNCATSLWEGGIVPLVTDTYPGFRHAREAAYRWDAPVCREIIRLRENSTTWEAETHLTDGIARTYWPNEKVARWVASVRGE